MDPGEFLVSSEVATVQIDVAPGLPQVNIVATDDQAVEVNGDLARFTIRRTGDASSALVVAYATGGTASTQDYNARDFRGEAVIPAGLRELNLSVKPTHDQRLEPAETLTLSLLPRNSYLVVGSPVATVSIVDRVQDPLILKFDIDVDGNKDLGGPMDGVAKYLPGYAGDVPMLSTGTRFGDPQYVGQGMKLVVEGAGKASGVEQVLFFIDKVSDHPGFAENASSSSITGVHRDDDYSFSANRDRRSFSVLPQTQEERGGKMEDDRTWVNFWCKDYGGQATVEAWVYRNEKYEILTLRIPLDAEGDEIADSWEIRKVEEWNRQYDATESVDNRCFTKLHDKELIDPDGPRNADGGTDLPAHEADGDGRSVFQEYRGYILDGGGFDGDGNHGHGGGHTRLSPVFKELLVEVDAAAGVPGVPDRAGISKWMDSVAKGMSQQVDGAGLRMLYVVDQLNTDRTTFDPAGTGKTALQLRDDYAKRYKHAELASFKHLLLVDRFADMSGAGLTSGANAWSMYSVPIGQEFARAFVIDLDQAAPALISHELHHAIITQEGNDKFEHFSDPSGNNAPREDPNDVSRVLYNYNRGLANDIGAADAEIPLDDVAGLPVAGVIVIEREIIQYTGIRGAILTGCTRGAADVEGRATAAVAHKAGAAVQAGYNADDMRAIRYGSGTVRFIRIR
jgi:hypothetical protein